MLVPGHALERYGERHTRRNPGAVRVLKRRLLSSPMNLRSFPTHTGIFPCKRWEIQEQRLEWGLRSTSVDRLPLQREEGAQIGDRAGQKPRNNKILISEDWLFSQTGIFLLGCYKQTPVHVTMQKKNYKNMIRTERSSPKTGKHWLLFFNLAPLNKTLPPLPPPLFLNYVLLHPYSSALFSIHWDFALGLGESWDKMSLSVGTLLYPLQRLEAPPSAGWHWGPQTCPLMTSVDTAKLTESQLL